jgi:outer membrane protein OmpA-like peptidoglycan-associated protein/tetratricopeptide (TPR) repeat protein
MTKIYFLSLLSFSLVTSIFSQQEDASCLAPDKKIVKKILLAKASPDGQKAAMLFAEAIAAEPDNAMVYYEFGMYAYENGSAAYEKGTKSVGEKAFIKAETLFEKALDLCSDYHANCFYYLGVINYTQKDMASAKKWFDGYKAYKHDDATRYPEDHDQKLKDINAVMGDLQAESDIMAKPVPFDPIMVANVSSDKDEYFPMISPDNELIFYTRKLDRRAKGDLQGRIVEEFSFSQRKDLSLNFDNGVPFIKPFNDGTFMSYGAATLAVDNKEMIICACKDEEVRGQIYRNCDLYSTTYERVAKTNGVNDFKWSALKNLGPGINTNDGWEGQPTMSADGNTMYYTAVRPTTRDNDIFIAVRSADGSWSKSRPFDEINTAGKDKSPFIHQDSETLYFASSCSDTRKGVGGVDLFYVRMKEDGTWEKPVNLGYPINSKEDELGIFVSTDGHKAYYSSRANGTEWNIYSFELYEEARPKSVVILKGELKDASGDPITDATIEIAYSGSDVVSNVRVNGNDGKYAAVIKTSKPQDIMVTMKKEGAAFESKLIEKEVIAEIASSTVIDKPVSLKNNDLKVNKVEVGQAYTINDILYATNSDQLSDKAKFILKQFAKFLTANETISIAIQGHTDDQGDDAKNMTLSDRRAKGVQAYLVSLGIDGERLNAKGFGETQPKVKNLDATSRAVNRRTDFVIEGM